jgi:hypothetical protein
MGGMRTEAFAIALLSMATSVPASELLYPLVSDWEQHFRIESQVSTRDGKSVVSGTLWNTTNWGAKRIQLLVDGLDTSGTPVSQRVVWLGIDLPAGTHGYFEIPVPSSPAYRVSVFAFDSRRGRWG